MASVKQAQTIVPKFGNWDVNGDVPYTMVFEKVRVGKGGKVDNPNDPFEYPTILGVRHPASNGGKIASSDDPTEYPATLPLGRLKNKHPTSLGQKTVRTSETARGTSRGIAVDHPHLKGTLGKDSRYSHKQAFDSPAPSQTTLFHRGSRENQPVYQSQVNSSYGGFTGGLRRPTSSDSSPRVSPIVVAGDKGSGYVETIKESYSHRATTGPSYQTHQGRIGSNLEAAAGPDLYKKASYDSGGENSSSSNLTGRSRTPSGSIRDRSAVPKFGDWDVNDPASAEGFTVIFDKARKERKFKAAPSQPKSSVGVDEDLYKPSFSQKNSTGLRNMLCCRSAASP